jgi:hypothetical protein
MSTPIAGPLGCGDGDGVLPVGATLLATLLGVAEARGDELEPHAVASAKARTTSHFKVTSR